MTVFFFFTPHFTRVGNMTTSDNGGLNMCLGKVYERLAIFTELRLAQLALDSSNSPAWDVPEQEKRPSTKMPLFVKALPVFSSPYDTEVRCYQSSDIAGIIS